MNCAVILAGGKGLRMGEDIPKQFMQLGGRAIIFWSIELFASLEEIDCIIITCPEDYIPKLKEMLKERPCARVIKIIAGGETRQLSSYNAIQCHDFADSDILLFHDAARPFVNERIVKQCIIEADSIGAAGVYVPSIDTIAEVEEGLVSRIPPRKNLYNTQTPQSFRYGIIKDSHMKALTEGRKNATDDVSLALDAGYSVKLVVGDYSNIKITSREDYQRAVWNLDKFSD